MESAPKHGFRLVYARGCNAEDGDFFDVPAAKLPIANLRRYLPMNSSSDEDEITSGDQSNSDDDDTITDDVCRKLQSQLSTLTIQTNSTGPLKENTKIPSKYLLDELGRRWCVKPTIDPISEQLTVPNPKHQNGRSKLAQKPTSNRGITAAVELWSYFMPDKFLEIHVLPWLIQKPISDDRNTKEKTRGQKAKAILEPQKPVVSMDELKAVLAIIYARAAVLDIHTNYEEAWESSCFAPSFFNGTMKKEKFFEIFTDLAQLKPADTPHAPMKDTPTFIMDFNYRLLQAFEPGDTLTITDRIVDTNLATPSSPFMSPGGQNSVIRKATISWLRDSRSGYYLKLAPPEQKLQDSFIVDTSHMDGAFTKRVDVNNALRFLLNQPPISGSGRTVYFGPLHAGVDCAEQLFSTCKLRMVGQLPSSGFYDSRVPFVAKSRFLLKRTINSTLFLFDYPLTLVSYQRRSAGRTPDVLISTAHFSKDKSDIEPNGNSATANDSRRKPPSAWIDYRRFMQPDDDSIRDVYKNFTTFGKNASMPLDRLLFFDCLFASAFNGFILWDMQQAKKADENKKKSSEFKTYLKLLACQLAKPYITKRLASQESDSNGWRNAAKRILMDMESEDTVMDGQIESKAGATANAMNENDPTMPKEEKGQVKKRAKRRK